MEEAEQSLDSKEDRLKNGTDPSDGAFKKVSTEMKNGDGNMMEEVKNYGDENNSFGELKETGNAVDGEEKEVGDSQHTDEKKIQKTKDRAKKKELEVQNGNEKFVVEGKDGEANRVLERAEDARDKKSAEVVVNVKINNEKYGLGDVEAIGGKSKEEGSNPIDDISVKELKNGKTEEGVEEMKDHEHSKPTSGEKGEDSVLVQVEENDGGRARKEAKDMEMMEPKDVVYKEPPDVKDEGKVVAREGEEEKKVKGKNADKSVGDNEKAESLKRKRGKERGRGRRPFETGEAKKNDDTKENDQELEIKGIKKRSKEVLSTPVVSSSDRPVRERKTVERLVEVIEKGPDSTVIIEKGRGTPLREIPNVAYNLARKKPAELKLLHQTLFGRKGKAVDFKNNLLQFSGFAWHESEEKQRAKIKEKLDKCVKETLLELCDLFDLTVSKTNTKKDEIIVKVLDFLEAPQAMSGAMHAEKQSSNSRKRERTPKVDASKKSGGNLKKRSRQKHDKTKGTPNSDVKSFHDTEEDDEDDSEEQSQKEDEVRTHSDSDAEKELVETDDEDESEVDADLRKGKQVKKSSKREEKHDVKSPKKQVSSESVKRKIDSNSKKTSPKTDSKSSLKTPPSKHPKDEKINDTGGKTYSRNKNDAESPKKSNSKSNSKEKSSGKASKSKAKTGKEQKSGPTKAELSKSICEILKQVDFNTATFTDILKQLASEYKRDLTPKKAAIKLMIQDELTKLAEEDEESQEEAAAAMQ